MILIYITCKDKREAEKISKHMLKKRLIACANIFPVKSLYNWKGRLCRADEAVLLAKTNDRMYDNVRKEVRKIHSYEIPCIIKMKADADREYENWVSHEGRR